MDKGKIEIITLDNYKLGPKQIENTYGNKKFINFLRIFGKH